MFIVKRLRLTTERLVVAEVRNDCKQPYWEKDAKPFTRVPFGDEVVEVIENWRPLTDLEVALLKKQED